MSCLHWFAGVRRWISLTDEKLAKSSPGASKYSMDELRSKLEAHQIIKHRCDVNIDELEREAKAVSLQKGKGACIALLKKAKIEREMRDKEMMRIARVETIIRDRQNGNVANYDKELDDMELDQIGPMAQAAMEMNISTEAKLKQIRASRETADRAQRDQQHLRATDYSHRVGMLSEDDESLYEQFMKENPDVADAVKAAEPLLRTQSQSPTRNLMVMTP